VGGGDCIISKDAVISDKTYCDLLIYRVRVGITHGVVGEVCWVGHHDHLLCVVYR
jgi:hypothetical protein